MLRRKLRLETRDLNKKDSFKILQRSQIKKSVFTERESFLSCSSYPSQVTQSFQFSLNFPTSKQNPFLLQFTIIFLFQTAE